MRSLYLLLPKCKHEETLSIGNFFSHRSRNKSAKGKVSTSGFFNRPNSGWAAISAAFLCGTTLASTELYQIRVKCPTIFSFVALSNIEIFRFVATKLFFLFHSVPIFRRKEKTFILFLQHNASFSDFFDPLRNFVHFWCHSLSKRDHRNVLSSHSSGFCSQVFASEARSFDTHHFLPWLYSQSTAEILSSSFYNNPQNYPRTKSPKKVFFNFFTIFPCNTLTFCISFFSLFLLLPHFICH